MMIYILIAILFIISMYTLIFHTSLMKKIIALNIANTSVVLLFVISASSIGNTPPLSTGSSIAVVDPVVHALMLTAIVVGVCITSFSLALVVHLYATYHTFNIDKIIKREHDTD